MKVQSYSTSAKENVAFDEGLRQFMLKVYGYMSAGLGITGVIAWLFANAYVSDGL